MGDMGATPAVYSARPRIELGGEVRPLLAEGLITLLVEETTAGLYRCEATFGNWAPGGDGAPDFAYFDRSLFDFGKRLVLEGGAGETQATLFDGSITGLEAHYPNTRPPELTVLAEDRLQDLRMTRRTRVFEDATLADVVQQVAGDHSLNPPSGVPSDPSSRVIAQVNQSDLAFLREEARRQGQEVWVEGEDLKMEARSTRRADEVTLTYGQGLREFSVLADLAQQCTTFVVSGWDVQAKTAIAAEATSDAIESETNGGRSGAELLQSAFAPRPEQIVHSVPLTEAEAEAQAAAEFRRRARRFVEGRGVALGDARIRVGTRLTLERLGPMFSGEYTVVGVQHTFDVPTGFRTRFEVQRPAIETQ